MDSLIDYALKDLYTAKLRTKRALCRITHRTGVSPDEAAMKTLAAIDAIDAAIKEIKLRQEADKLI